MGRPNHAVGTVKQRNAEMGFEIADAVADRRGADIQRARSLLEAAEPDRDIERLQRQQVRRPKARRGEVVPSPRG